MVGVNIDGKRTEKGWRRKRMRRQRGMKIVRREIGEGDKDIRVDLSSMAFSCVATDSG